MPKTDERFGPYLILGQLGAGGMGEVFLARDPRLERDVVLKMLPAEVARDTERMARFRHEALALAAINHPNIATIFGFEESGVGVLALVLERVEGVTLAERLKRGAMPPNEALRVCAQIAEALEAAHARGVIHRDLKPENVMLAPNGLVKVLDFGLAQRVGEASLPVKPAPSGAGHRATAVESRDTVMLAASGNTPGSDGEVSGSPGYMSPEQARGEHQDNRTDVFAFGCVLFECLTGARAVEGGAIVGMMGRGTDTRVDLSPLPERTPAPIRDLLGRCLERDVNQRLAEIRTARIEIEEVLGIRRASALRTGEQVAAAPHQLPFQATPFVARKRVIEDCIGLLRTTRLLTITGVGGGGKTRLAMRLAEMLVQEFPDGVWFVDLASLNDPEHVPEAVATVLGIGEEAGGSATEAVARHLATRRALIVLDGCEHLLGACGELTRALFAATPDVKVIATSRESLGVPGETTYTVPAMSLPQANQLRDLAAIRAAEAVQLFLDRAVAVRPDFVLDAEKAPAVVEICRRLDGIPLAIELAAARMRVLSVEQILARLNDRFRLLAGGHAALARHQTLRASIQWSHDQLTADEQRLLRAASVVAGGWTLEAGAACVEDWDEFQVLDLLTRLVEKSLVVVERIDGEDTRYRCLESVRQFAEELLIQGGENHAARNRHRDWFLDFAERAAKHVRGPDQARWYDRIEAEIDNLRVALEWSRDDPQGAEPALRLASALGGFWAVRGYCREGRQWIAETLARTSFPPSPTLASVLMAAGNMAYRQDDLETARHYYQQSLEVRRKIGDERAIAGVLGSLGNVAQSLGEWHEARSLFEQSLESSRKIGNRVWDGTSLTCLGNVTRYLGDLEAGRAYLEEALAITQEVGNLVGEAIALQGLGDLSLQVHDFDAAATYYERSMAFQEKLGDRHSQAAARIGLAVTVGRRGDHARSRALFEEGFRALLDIGNRLTVGTGLEELAGQLLVERKAAEAARMLGAANALREAIHSPVPPSRTVELERTITSAREALGEKAFALEWERGRKLSPEQAVEDVFGAR
jgi:predicted ATPase